MATFGKRMTMAERLKRHRQQEARRYAMQELDVLFQQQRHRVTILLREAGKRVEKARRGGEYGDEIIVTEKRA